MANNYTTYDYKFRSPLIFLEKENTLKFCDLDFEDNQTLIIEISKDSINEQSSNFFFKIEGDPEED